MVYTLSLFVCLLSAVMSQSLVKFSSTDSFGSECSTDNEITELDGSDSQSLLYFCVFLTQVEVGDYSIDFYDSSDNVVYSIGYTRGKDASGLTIHGYVYVATLVDNSGSTQTFTLKFEDDSETTFASGSIAIINVAGSTVEDIAVRLSAPQTLDDYSSSAEDSYSDGDTIYISSQNTYGYFCSIYSLVLTGYKVQFHFEGQTSGAQFSGNLHEISSTYSSEFTFYYCDAESFNKYSLDDETIKVTSYLYDSNDNELASKSIYIQYIVGNGVETTPKPETTVEAETTTSTTSTTKEAVLEGWCEEKPGKSKSACQYQETQADCESYRKCQWVYAPQ
jgi:hypothetical protein